MPGTNAQPPDRDAPSECKEVSTADFVVPRWAAFNMIASIDGLVPRAQARHLAHRITCWLRGASKFESLPNEVLTEIILYLDLRDIMSLSPTCRRLSSLCHARPIWISVFREYRQLLGLPWNIPVEKYSTDALAGMVRRRLRAEVGWRNGEAPKERSLHSAYDGYGNAAPVPGGRWLLQVSERAPGCVFAYDLDADLVPPPRLIIEHEGASEVRSLYHIAIDVNHSEPLLTFNLCVFPQFFLGQVYSSGEKPIPSLRIYRVSCTGHGGDSVLKADKLTSFSLSSTGRWRHVSFNGPYFARHLVDRTANEDRVEVYDWTRSNELEHFKAFVFCPDHDLVQLTLLPERRLLCFFEHRLALYSIANLTSLPDGQIKDVSRPDLIWTHDEIDGKTIMLSGHDEISRPLVDPQVLRISFVTSNFFCGLTIHRLLNRVELAKVSDLRPSNMCTAMGVHRLVLHFSAQEVLYAGLHWPDVPDLCKLDTTRNREIARRAVSARAKGAPFIDELTGRVVLTSRNKWTILHFGEPLCI